jgi:4-alpha-glucanotransferase
MLCDQVRIDHFRGLEACWQIPVDQPTAVYGQWVKAPGEALLKAMQTTLGTLPIIAEDLGMITPEVEALRDRFDLPGMKVLQFAFGGDLKNPFLPHNYPCHCNSLVYTGTHDNDTTLGWYRSLNENERSFLHTYLKRYHLAIKKDQDAPWVLLTLALRSRAKQAIVPLQDLLGLGTESRMNFPSHIEGNWAWRYQPDALDRKLAKRLKELAVSTNRANR